MMSAARVLALLLAPLCLRAQEPPTLRVTRAIGAIRLDGRLSEPAWRQAVATRSLGQVEPIEGGTTASATLVRVLATDDELLIGVELKYAPGVPRVAFARSRDAVLTNEDHLMIVFDPTGDGRSGYVFGVNRNGARYDALISGSDGSENANWDAIWSAATADTEDGWSAEIRIPVNSLLFPSGRTSWGFNIQRRIQALQETDRWASALRNYKVTQTSRAGTLTDLPTFAIGRGLSVRPSLVGGAAYDSLGAPLRAQQHASLDVVQRIGAGTRVALSLNTDFAETEVDSRRVNLSRFPLFFPEKRTFFLEGSDLFDFGLALGSDVIPFFSRRIGLLNGAEVPVTAGIKATGRVEGTNFGVLATRTGATRGLSTDATMGAIRIKRNILGESSVGFIATSGDPLGRADSWLVGPDIVLQTSRFQGDKNLRLGLWALATGRRGLTGDRSAAGMRLAYPNDRWDIFLDYKRIGDAFDPSIGFVPRAGVHLAALTANWNPRPTQPILGMNIRQCFWENELTYAAGLSGGWQSYRYFMAPVNCRLESGDRFEFNIVPTGEHLTAPFDVARGVTLPAGEYHFRRFRLEAGLAQKRRLSLQATWWFGQFYNGSLDQYILTATWRPSALVIVELSGEHDVGGVTQGRFVSDLLGTRLRLNFSSDLQLSSYVQYSSDDRAVGTNSRLRWTWSPLGELFLIYNHALRTRDPLTGQPTLGLASNALLAKLQYAWQY